MASDSLNGEMPKQEHHYRSLFSRTLNGIAYCKVLTEGPPPHDFVYLEVNEAFENQTGLKNVVGKKVSEIVPGIREQDPWLLNLYSEVAATGRPQKFERYVEALKAWFSVSVYCPEEGYFVAVFDVTTRQREAAALRESEERLATIAAYVPGMLYTYVLYPDGTNRFLYVGPRCRDILEIDERSIMADSSHFWNRIHPGDLERVRQEDVAANREGRSFSSEFRVVTPSGGVKWVRVVSRPAPARPGEPAVWNGFILDITQRKADMEGLAASEAKYRGLFASLMDGFVSVDMEGVIRESNEVYRKMLGYSPEELTQITYKDITPERWHPMEARIIEEQVLPRGYSEVYEKEYRRKDGTDFPVELRTFLLKEGGRPVAMWAIVRDVTEVRALQMRLAVAGRMAALGTLVAGIAHEINNPLAAVMGNHAVALETIGKMLGAIRSGAPADRGLELRLLDQVEAELRDSEAGGWRIQRIVKDLTTIGRPDAPRSRVRLTEVMDGALRWLPPGVRLAAQIRVEDHGAPDILAAAGQIEQVLVNLIVNAVKASPAGKAAPVRVWIGPGEPGLARLEVIDQGTGIDPAVLPRIFEPFFTTRDVGQGTGLGLAVSHAIATAHGGTISVESKAGLGSTFRVELPVAPADV